MGSMGTRGGCMGTMRTAHPCGPMGSHWDLWWAVGGPWAKGDACEHHGTRLAFLHGTPRGPRVWGPYGRPCGPLGFGKSKNKQFTPALRFGKSKNPAVSLCSLLQPLAARVLHYRLLQHGHLARLGHYAPIITLWDLGFGFPASIDQIQLQMTLLKECRWKLDFVD